MAKKLCELCQQELESEMRFGVRMCKTCYATYEKALDGDAQARDHMADPAAFPNATQNAKESILDFFVNRQQMAREAHQQAPQPKQEPRQAYAAPQPAVKVPKTDEDGLYANIGKKIKGWAKGTFIVEAVVAVITAVFVLISAVEEGEAEAFLGALAILILGPLVAWVSSWLLYGFGELVDKTSANEENTRAILKLLQEQQKKQ